MSWFCKRRCVAERQLLDYYRISSSGHAENIAGRDGHGKQGRSMGCSTDRPANQITSFKLHQLSPYSVSFAIILASVYLQDTLRV